MINSLVTTKPDGSIKSRYIVLTTHLKAEEIMTIAKTVDPYLANVLRITTEDGEETVKVRASVYKAQRVPKFARFLYEVMGAE